MAFGADTWTFTNQPKNKLAAAHTMMERNMLDTTNLDRKNHLVSRKNYGHRRNWTSEKTEVGLGRARQQDPRWPMEWRQLETLRKEKT